MLLGAFLSVLDRPAFQENEMSKAAAGVVGFDEALEDGAGARGRSGGAGDGAGAAAGLRTIACWRRRFMPTGISRRSTGRRGTDLPCAPQISVPVR